MAALLSQHKGDAATVGPLHDPTHFGFSSANRWDAFPPLKL